MKYKRKKYTFSKRELLKLLIECDSKYYEWFCWFLTSQELDEECENGECHLCGFAFHSDCSSEYSHYLACEEDKAYSVLLKSRKKLIKFIKKNKVNINQIKKLEKTNRRLGHYENYISVEGVKLWNS